MMKTPLTYNVHSIPCSLHAYRYRVVETWGGGGVGDLLTNMICNLSTPIPLGVILLAININRNLVTIHPKLKGMILSLFLKTGNDYSLAVNSMEFLYQLVYLRFTCYKLKIIDILQFLTSEGSRTNSSRFWG